MAPLYRVTLREAERGDLERLSTTGTKAAKKVLHVRALLLVDAGEHEPHWPSARVCKALGMDARSL